MLIVKTLIPRRKCWALKKLDETSLKHCSKWLAAWIVSLSGFFSNVKNQKIKNQTFSRGFSKFSFVQKFIQVYLLQTAYTSSQGGQRSKKHW